MAETAAAVLLPRPDQGRVYSSRRRVRFGDVDPGGRVRLDALSTYVQDVASDDTEESGLGADLVWVVRRALIEVRPSPRYLETLELGTWCSGIGRRWAERRVSMQGDRGACVEVAMLWVALDQSTNRPVPLPATFLEGAAPAAQGREVSARLQHPTALGGADEAGAVERLPWPLRATDFDLLGHVNNAAAWAMVEELLAGIDRRSAVRAELEYRAPVEIGTELELHVQRRGPASFSLWATGSGKDQAPDAEPTLFTTAVVEPLTG